MRHGAKHGRSANGSRWSTLVRIDSAFRLSQLLRRDRSMSGRRSFGSVRKRSSDEWEARYHDKRGEVDPQYFVTKAAATAHLAVVESDTLQGQWLDP
jgi:hypothetical protein